jgi:amino acid permease
MLLALVIFIVVAILATTAGQTVAIVQDVFKNGSPFAKAFTAVCIAAPVVFILWLVLTVQSAVHPAP